MNKTEFDSTNSAFFKLESAGGILLLFSAVVAMLLANSPLNQNYKRLFKLTSQHSSRDFFYR